MPPPPPTSHGTRIYSPINFVDLLAYGPDLNVIMDPRNGRNGENPSECPTLTGAYAVEVVRGAQEGEDPHHTMLSMGAWGCWEGSIDTDAHSADVHSATRADPADAPSSDTHSALLTLCCVAKASNTMLLTKLKQTASRATPT